MKTLRFFFYCLVYLVTHVAFGQRADSVYTLRTGREIALLGTGISLCAVAVVTGQNLKPLEPSVVQALDRQQLSALNRPATYQWSPTADRLSDLTLLGNAGIVGLISLPGLRQKNWLTVSVMYLETLLLANGIQRSIKNLSQERRPYVYNPDVPLTDRTQKDALRSFFSSHASNAFASAVLAGEVFRHQFPHSRWKPVVWGSGLALATATSVLRYKAGQHFPADLLVGAAFGSAMGWLIPKLHQRQNRARISVTPWSNGLANGVYVRYMPVYR